MVDPRRTKDKKTSKNTKPAKPHPDFPLTPNGNGQWSKKVRGKVYYFGPWADPEPRCNAGCIPRMFVGGQKPRPKDGGFTIKDLCNAFLTSKQAQLQSGEITTRTFYVYNRVTDRVVATFDRTRLVEDLTPEDFGELREQLAAKMGPVALGNEISRTRVLFNFAFDNHHISRPVRFGALFKRPSKRVLRQERNKRGVRMFEQAEIRKLLAAADPQLKAMILLGINCGFGNTDCSTLPQAALDLDAGWVDFPAPKPRLPAGFRCGRKPLMLCVLFLRNAPSPRTKKTRTWCSSQSTATDGFVPQRARKPRAS